MCQNKIGHPHTYYMSAACMYACLYAHHDLLYLQRNPLCQNKSVFTYIVFGKGLYLCMYMSVSMYVYAYACVCVCVCVCMRASPYIFSRGACVTMSKEKFPIHNGSMHPQGATHEGTHSLTHTHTKQESPGHETGQNSACTEEKQI